MAKKIILAWALGTSAMCGVVWYAVKPVDAQGIAPAAPITMTSTTVGSTSHAWAIDPRSNLIILCTAGVDAKPVCTRTTLPGIFDGRTDMRGNS